MSAALGITLVLGRSCCSLGLWGVSLMEEGFDGLEKGPILAVFSTNMDLWHWGNKAVNETGRSL